MSQTTRQGGDQLFPGRAAVAVPLPPPPTAIRTECQGRLFVKLPEIHLILAKRLRSTLKTNKNRPKQKTT